MSEPRAAKPGAVPGTSPEDGLRSPESGNIGGPGGSEEKVRRVFVAIKLDPELRSRIHRHAQQLLVGLRSVRIPAPDNLHLTLRFLGDTEPSRVSFLADLLREAAAMEPPFEMALGDRGQFPTHGPPRVLWVGIVEKEGRLMRLQRRVEAACAHAGFPRERRPFHPHITFGRVAGRRHPRARDTAGDAGSRFFAGETVRQRVDAIVLESSELRPTGSVYTDLAVLPLPVV